MDNTNDQLITSSVISFSIDHPHDTLYVDYQQKSVIHRLVRQKKRCSQVFECHDDPLYLHYNEHQPQMLHIAAYLKLAAPTVYYVNPAVFISSFFSALPSFAKQDNPQILRLLNKISCQVCKSTHAHIRKICKRHGSKKSVKRDQGTVTLIFISDEVAHKIADFGIIVQKVVNHGYECEHGIFVLRTMLKYGHQPEP